MKRFSNSFSAELLKVRSTKMWLILAIVLLVYSAMMAALFGALFGVAADSSEGMFSGQFLSDMVYSSVAAFGYVIPLLFGAIMATGEIRHRTLALAFLAEPRREILLTAKLAVLVVTGALLGVAGLVGSVVAGGLVFTFFEMPTNLLTLETLLLFIRVIVVVALWSVIGFGLGLLIKNQAFAIVIALVFTQFIEPTLRTAGMFWEWSANIVKFFPGSATDAFVGASLLANMSALDAEVPQISSILSIWQGGLVLFGIAALVTILGWATRWRKDVV